MLAIIAAVAKNRVIGNRGKIPWDIPGDRAHFKELTMGHAVVMGRRTFEEIGHPLPGRMNYIVSSTLQIEEEDCCTVSSLREAAERAGDRDIFVCGGAMLYREALESADWIYLTELSWEVEGDTFFPEIPQAEFRETVRVSARAGEKTIDYVALQRN